MTLPFLQVRYAVALMVSVVVTIGLLRLSAAAADTVVASYGTPGTYALTIPQYATSMTIAANGGSGTLGARDGGQVNAGPVTLAAPERPSVGRRSGASDCRLHREGPA